MDPSRDALRRLFTDNNYQEGSAARERTRCFRSYQRIGRFRRGEGSMWTPAYRARHLPLPAGTVLS